MHPPSVTIASGDCHAVIALRGGGPSRLTWRGQDLLEGYGGPGQPSTAPLSANVVLAPWPNRTADGRFTFGGEDHQLRITEPEASNALHGFGADREWTQTAACPGTVSIELDPGPQPGWPWPVHLSVTYRVDSDGLRAEFVLRNDATTDIPAACGFHLYPSALGAATDTCTLTVPDHGLLPLDDRGLPAGPVRDDGSVLPATDNRLGDAVLDHCLHVRDDATPRFVLRRPDGAGVAVTTSPELRWFQVFTPDERSGMPYPGRPGGRAVAVEPMTAPPDALNSGTDLARLPPGGHLACSWHVGPVTPHP